MGSITQAPNASAPVAVDHRTSGFDQALAMPGLPAGFARRCRLDAFLAMGVGSSGSLLVEAIGGSIAKALSLLAAVFTAGICRGGPAECLSAPFKAGIISISERASSVLYSGRRAAETAKTIRV